MNDIYNHIKQIVDNHIDEIKESIYEIDKYYALTDMSDEERFKYVTYGVIEIYEKYRKEK